MAEEGFKRRNRSEKRPVRVSVHVDSAEDDEEQEESLEALHQTRLLQKLRQRSKGVNAAELAVGAVNNEEAAVDDDPYKLKTGGLVDAKKKEAASGIAIGSAFSRETQVLDEDKHMKKFIEDQMAKISGSKAIEQPQEVYQDPRAALFELPEHLKKLAQPVKPAEEAMSSQFLSGIPEVDLGIEAKMANVEHTERAKQALAEKLAANRDTHEVSREHLAVGHKRFFGVTEQDIGKLHGGVGGGNSTDDAAFDRFKKRSRK